MNKTKIDWCDSTWNPVTGCLHRCEYCYARNMARRFSYDGETLDAPPELQRTWIQDSAGSGAGNHVLRYPMDTVDGRRVPYPFGFAPTLHRYRLDEYASKKGRNIFACSMADLFGKWVPDDWKIEVLKACYKAPQHNYLFLTKDPVGYSIWKTEKHKDFCTINAYRENMWLGVTYTGKERLEGHYQEWEIGNGLSTWSNFWYLWRMSGAILPTKAHKFISIEPLSCDICDVEDEREGGKLLENFLLPKGYKSFFEWIIVGAETGNRKDRVVPKREWVEKLVDLCRRAGIPIFMKSSLTPIWGEPLIQEFPMPLEPKLLS